MSTDDIIDLMVTVVVLALFTAITIYHTIPLYRGEFGGFDVLVDKTALPTVGEIEPKERTFTDHDAILMLVIADDYFPEPRVVDINGTIIDIDTPFLKNRTAALIQAAGAMPVDDDMSCKLLVGPGGRIKWVIRYE